MQKKKTDHKLLYLASNSHFQTFHTLSGSLMYNKLNLICTTKQVFFFSTGSLKSLHKKDVLLISIQYPLEKSCIVVILLHYNNNFSGKG